jgi:hypothetical protein
MKSGRRSDWCCEPALNLTRVPRGTTECRSRLGSTHRKLCEQGATRSATLKWGCCGGGRQRALLWIGCAQADGGGLRAMLGDPVGAIESVAEGEHADIIMLGTSAGSVPARLGQTARTLLRRSSRPVLLIRSDACVGRYGTHVEVPS